LRELREETGVEAGVVGLIDVVDGLFTSRGGGECWGHYVLVDFAARWLAGEPRAGDDAADARFVALPQIGELHLWAETVRVIHAAELMLSKSL
jgi:8-oxo-dGTP diphosphatase